MDLRNCSSNGEGSKVDIQKVMVTLTRVKIQNWLKYQIVQ